MILNFYREPHAVKYGQKWDPAPQCLTFTVYVKQSVLPCVRLAPAAPGIVSTSCLSKRTPGLWGSQNNFKFTRFRFRSFRSCPYWYRLYMLGWRLNMLENLKGKSEVTSPFNVTMHLLTSSATWKRWFINSQLFQIKLWMKLDFFLWCFWFVKLQTKHRGDSSVNSSVNYIKIKWLTVQYQHEYERFVTEY